MAVPVQGESRKATGSQMMRRIGLAALLAVPLALASSAAAGLIVAVVAVPVALLATRDAYLALLSLSYGPYAAAVTLQAVLAATLAWSIIEPLMGAKTSAKTPRAFPLMLGALAGAVGLAVGALPLFAAFAVPWRYGPALPFSGASAPFAALLGVLAAGAHVFILNRRPLPATHLMGWRAGTQQTAWRILTFAVPLAVLFATWAALLAALGQI